jgi:hypothetical protein
MTRSRKHSLQNQDDQLAEFTDRLLAGQDGSPAPSGDAELRGLEETVVRLKGAFPNSALDPAGARRMQADFQARLRRAGRDDRSAWRSVRSRQSRLGFGLLFGAIAIVLLLLVLTPLLGWSDEGILGSAGTQYPGLGLAAVLGGLLLLVIIVWLARRK